MNLTYKIHKELYGLFKSHDYKLQNTFVFKWESDFLSITKSGYVQEVEVKVSKSDFNNDKNKNVGRSNIKKHDFLLDSKFDPHFKPNKFFYAIPEGLIDFNEINPIYGIILLKKDKNGRYFLTKKREAKFIHKENLLNQNWFLMQMMKKFYYRNIDLTVALNIRRCDIKYNQKRLFDVTYY